MNYDRFCAVLDHIEQHPEQWDQEHPFPSDRRKCFLAHAVAMFSHIRYGGVLYDGTMALHLSYDQGNFLWAVNRTLQDFQRVRLVYARTRFAPEAFGEAA